MVIRKIPLEKAVILQPNALADRRYYGYYKKNLLVGVVGIKFRSWFLSELCHLFVRPEHRRQGVGKKLVEYALQKVRTPLTCATVIEGKVSNRIFSKLGFHEVAKFTNPVTGNRIVLYLKIN